MGRSFTSNRVKIDLWICSVSAIPMASGKKELDFERAIKKKDSR
jgi:hypothetical protein